jgi:hypothetical protein
MSTGRVLPRKLFAYIAYPQLMSNFADGDGVDTLESEVLVVDVNCLSG